MNQPNVLVVGYPTQIQTSHQLKSLKQFNITPIIIDPYGSNGDYAPLSWSEDKIIWDSNTLIIQNIMSVLLCNHAPDIPTEDSFFNHSRQCLSWPEWFQFYGLQRDRSDTLLGLLLSLEHLGIPCYNPPSKSHLSRRKPYQLHLMRSVGCKVPPTLITNNPEAAAEFITSQGDCIVKPAAGGTLTLSANELLAQGDLHKLAAPAIFQKRIRGRDIRVIVIDQEVISSAIIDIPEDTLDFRGDEDYQNGRAQYIEITLPHEVQKQCLKAAEVLGLKFTGIDIRITPDNEYYLLECNSSPIYLDVEYKLGHPITEKLVQALSKPKN